MTHSTYVYLLDRFDPEAVYGRARQQFGADLNAFEVKPDTIWTSNGTHFDHIPCGADAAVDLVVWVDGQPEPHNMDDSYNLAQAVRRWPTVYGMLRLDTSYSGSRHHGCLPCFHAEGAFAALLFSGYDGEVWWYEEMSGTWHDLNATRECPDHQEQEGVA